MHMSWSVYTRDVVMACMSFFPPLFLLCASRYNADSYQGWLAGDNYGGKYNSLIANGVPREHVAPGLGCWPATCGNHLCWTTTQPSGAQRMQRITADGMPEVAMFRFVQTATTKWPQDWWWPLLHAYTGK